MSSDMEKYYKKIENYYDSQGLLKQYPSKRPMRIIALAKIADQFEKDKIYSEKQVNEIVRNAILFEDIELVRRELFQHEMINRKRDGSEYWINTNWKEVYRDYWTSDIS